MTAYREHVIFVGNEFDFYNGEGGEGWLVAKGHVVPRVTNTTTFFITHIETTEIEFVDLKVDLLFDHEKKKITILNFSGLYLDITPHGDIQMEMDEFLVHHLRHELMEIMSKILRVYFGHHWRLRVFKESLRAELVETIKKQKGGMRRLLGKIEELNDDICHEIFNCYANIALNTITGLTN